MPGWYVRAEITGLKAFRKELRDVDKALGKDLRQAMLKASKLVEARARGASPVGHAASIRGGATQRAALLRIGPGRKGTSLATFLGQTQRSGWYGWRRYRRSTGRQFDKWVGNQWDPGDAGGKPYFIGDAINDSVDDVIDVLGDEIEQLAARAFPK